MLSTLVNYLLGSWRTRFVIAMVQLMCKIPFRLSIPRASLDLSVDIRADVVGLTIGKVP